MKSRHTDPHALLTPAMRGVLAAMARADRPPFHTLTAQQARAAYAAGAEVLEVPRRPFARVEDFVVSARDGFDIPCRLYSPLANAPVVGGQGQNLLPALVYFHGGGFIIGSIRTHDILCRELSFLAGCAVVSVDYRLAPEHKFPVAVHDAWDALQGLGKVGASLGIDAGRLAVGGDSAGGTLAAVCAVLARLSGLPLALQLLLYPGCAGHQETLSHQTFGKGFVLDEVNISWFFNHYVRNPTDRDDWHFAPLKAHDVDGVAPAWIGLAECDPLTDEGVMYADKLRMAGVPVDLEIYRGVTHEFIKMGRVIPQAVKAHADAAHALKRAFSI